MRPAPTESRARRPTFDSPRTWRGSIPNDAASGGPGIATAAWPGSSGRSTSRSRRALPTGAALIATTEVIGGRRVMARRQCDLRAEADGSPIARVVTDWVLTTTAGVPTRVPDAFAIAFGVPLGSFEPIRVDPGQPPADASRRSFGVRLHELDPMGHVNNAVYVDWLDEAIDLVDPVAIRVVPRRYRLEYRAAAAPGADLVGGPGRTARAGSIGWRMAPAGSALAGGSMADPTPEPERNLRAGRGRRSTVVGDR